MKKCLVFLIVLTVGFAFVSAQEVRLMPYISAGIEMGEMAPAVEKVEKLLTENGFNIVGRYSPLEQKHRLVIAATHDLLHKAVDKVGGLAAFATVWRFAIYKDANVIEISYMNPIYWCNAYFRKDFPKAESEVNALAKKLEEMFKALSDVKNQPFGSREGLTVKKLRKFRFGLFMPYFDDITVLAKKIDYEKKLERIEENFKKKLGGVQKVYGVEIPGKKMKIFGCALWGSGGEPYYLPVMDRKYPKQDAYLPYEFLVMEDKVIMLHGKYFIPLAYPDAGMGIFMKIMSGHSNTKKALTLIARL